ncbi:MAG: hypothetical protein ABW190_09255 [Rhizobacter sp.]
MKLFDRFRSGRAEPAAGAPCSVSFTGGMGAQILSAAIYFDKKDRGEVVFADVSYFDRPAEIHDAGKPGALSHWHWQLDRFSLPISMFSGDGSAPGQKLHAIVDGPEKMRLALNALEQPAVRARFQVPDGLADVLGSDHDDPFLCMHIRRGDYVNVADHLVSDAEFLAAAKPFAGLLRRLVILSDSAVPAALTAELEADFGEVRVLKVDAYDSHRVMRGARVLICSNSQFSLIAAAMNPKALVLVPKQWFTGKLREIEAPIQERCTFQMMSAPGGSAPGR